MKEHIRRKIIKLNAKGLSVYYIAKTLDIKSWDAQKVIEQNVMIDYETLFTPGEKKDNEMSNKRLQ
jgi:hypothetical protein